MPTLELTDDQIVNLIEQLPTERKQTVIKSLLTRRWTEWEELARYGEAQFRRVAAERGLQWDEMIDEERISFVDDLVHEDRACS